MIVTIDGIAGSGKSRLRDELLQISTTRGTQLSHVGQFSWLSFPATKTIVALRAGVTNATDSAATEAVRRDLTLHYRYNIGPQTRQGHVIADRLLSSTAALLSLLYGAPVAHYVRQLAPVTADYGHHLMVLLSTPPGICVQRTHSRPTRPRFGEDIAAASRLSVLTRGAACEWAAVTGQPLLTRSLETVSDTTRLARDIASQLEITATESEG